MHIFNIATLFAVLTLVGVELSVSAFVNPAAWRLAPEPQLGLLSRLAFVLGKVMPVCYPACAVLFGLQTGLHWHEPGIGFLLAADVIWAIVCVATILLLVPLNRRVAERSADWQASHSTWDRRHRVRIAALAITALLLAYFLVR